MDKKTWIIGICCSEGDGIDIYKIICTKEQAKKYLLRRVHADLLEEYDTIDKAVKEYGSHYCTETIDDIVEERDGNLLCAYATFYDYHIDYTAIAEDDLFVAELV